MNKLKKSKSKMNGEQLASLYSIIDNNISFFNNVYSMYETSDYKTWRIVPHRNSC